ncbi:MAG: SAF domain-containing protein [Clostridia bacterium]|nr:SAF domain-containing protein [Clostridia bacterium]
MKRYLNSIVSISLILGAIGAVILWEAYLDDLINTKEVVVATTTLEKNAVIGKADVKLARIPIDQVPENAITDPNKTIGKETAFIIRKGQQIVTDTIDFEGIVPNSDQVIVPIPKEWLVTVPGSLRRKDKVNIYEVPNKELAHKITADFTGLAGNNKPTISNVTVAYAKDPSNQEVKPAEQSKLRIDATGTISDLELVLTDEQLNSLKLKALEGYKFIVAYK